MTKNGITMTQIRGSVYRTRPPRRSSAWRAIFSAVAIITVAAAGLIFLYGRAVW